VVSFHAASRQESMTVASVQPYPLRFTPAVQEAAWGGALFGEFQGGGGAPAAIRWEVLDSAAHSSLVANGPLAGRPLGELVAGWGAELVGQRHRKEARFPVYVRILDVGRPLPMLVHPDETICRERPELVPNTKFWYCLATRRQGQFMVGIGARVTAMQMKQNLEKSGLPTLLQTFPAHPGDSYLIPAGRVHSAGEGVLIWEIGQNPLEPLEVQATGGEGPAGLAWRAIHFEDRQVARICRETGGAQITRRLPLVRHCPYFMVEEVRIVDNLFDRTDGSSFHLFSGVRGTVVVETARGEETLAAGDTCLLPAQMGGYRLVAKDGAAAVLRGRLQPLK